MTWPLELTRTEDSQIIHKSEKRALHKRVYSYCTPVMVFCLLRAVCVLARQFVITYPPLKAHARGATKYQQREKKARHLEQSTPIAPL